jgi:hypothetical protein
MAILTTINNIPLFTSIGEALAWARLNFTQGYHTHTHRGKVGYMGGKTHADATNRRINTPSSNVASTPQAIPPTPPPPLPVVTPQSQPVPQTPVVQQVPIPQPIQINYGSSGGGSGGGGGGY